MPTVLILLLVIQTVLAVSCYLLVKSLSLFDLFVRDDGSVAHSICSSW